MQLSLAGREQITMLSGFTLNSWPETSILPLMLSANHIIHSYLIYYPWSLFHILLSLLKPALSYPSSLSVNGFTFHMAENTEAIREKRALTPIIRRTYFFGVCAYTLCFLTDLLISALSIVFSEANTIYHLFWINQTYWSSSPFSLIYHPFITLTGFFS